VNFNSQVLRAVSRVSAEPRRRTSSTAPETEKRVVYYLSDSTYAATSVTSFNEGALEVLDDDCR
jgi:hypothetical protein